VALQPTVKQAIRLSSTTYNLSLTNETGGIEHLAVLSRIGSLS